jgi:hypothetical protein
LRVAGSLGFDVVEPSMRDASDVPLDELVALLDECRRRVSAIATGQACLFGDELASLVSQASSPSIQARPPYTCPKKTTFSYAEGK